MAAIPEHPPEIARLLELSAASRSRLGGQINALRQRVNVPAKVLHSLREHPLRWMGGAVATGLATTLLLRPRRSTARKSKRPGGLLFSLVLSAAIPVLKSWLTDQFKQRLITRLTQLAKPHPLPQNPETSFPH